MRSRRPLSLTPVELFDHRLAALLGRTVEEMRKALTERAYRKWQVYWSVEPWGPFRDNLHAAIVAREVRRPWVRKGTRIDLDGFMVKAPEQRARDAGAKFAAWLGMVAKEPGERDD